MAHRFLPIRPASVVLSGFVSLCVVLQLLGAPVTLLGLLAQDTPVESLSEEFSIPPSTPEPGTPSQSRFTVESETPWRFPVFSISVFHPPQG